MTGKTARLLFWLGTLTSAAIFLWMTWITYDRETLIINPLTWTYIVGLTVWHLFTLKGVAEGVSE